MLLKKSPASMVVFVRGGSDDEVDGGDCRDSQPPNTIMLSPAHAHTLTVEPMHSRHRCSLTALFRSFSSTSLIILISIPISRGQCAFYLMMMLLPLLLCSVCSCSHTHTNADIGQIHFRPVHILFF